MGRVKIALAALLSAELSRLTFCLLVQKKAVQEVEEKGGIDREDAAKDKVAGCLAGKRIVFVGPSTSKFDYMATAYFAEYGFFPTADQVNNLQGVPGPNPLNEHAVQEALPGMYFPPVTKWGCQSTDTKWESYYRYSNAIFNGNEYCDCYRFGNWRGPYDLYNNTENRVYTNGNTMLAYFQWFGDVVQPRGTYNILPLLGQPHYAAKAQCPVGQFPGSWSWGVGIDRFLSTVVRYARPTHLVVSSAFWPVKPEDTDLWNSIARAGIEAVMDTGGQVIWRSTPQRYDIEPALNYVSPRIQPAIQAAMTTAGWKFWNTQNIVEGFRGGRPYGEVFYDNAHLKPPAASHLADNFLKTYVCPELR